MNEPVKVTKKIISYKVVTEEGVHKTPDEQGVTYINPTDTLIQQLEELEDFEASKVIDAKSAEATRLIIKPELKRPLRLDNEWRLKPPYANHALYVRLNAIEYEGKKFPYEIFFNTKDVKDIKWLNALTVTISTAFRTAIETGTSLQSLIDNFKESCDTESPYLSKVPDKPRFVNGLVAEIGLVIEVFNKECLRWEENQCIHNDIDKRMEAYKQEHPENSIPLSQSSHERPATEEENASAWLDYVSKPLEDLHTIIAMKSASIEFPHVITNPCPDCGDQLIIMDGCPTCTSCGYSKCS
jgi:hypothetical protein